MLGLIWLRYWKHYTCIMYWSGLHFIALLLRVELIYPYLLIRPQNRLCLRIFLPFTKAQHSYSKESTVSDLKLENFLQHYILNITEYVLGVAALSYSLNNSHIFQLETKIITWKIKYVHFNIISIIAFKYSC